MVVSVTAMDASFLRVLQMEVSVCLCVYVHVHLHVTEKERQREEREREREQIVKEMSGCPILTRNTVSD